MAKRRVAIKSSLESLQEGLIKLLPLLERWQEDHGDEDSMFDWIDKADENTWDTIEWLQEQLDG